MVRSAEVADERRTRAPRADAARNHETLLAAASEAYGEKGVDASLEDIARRAGVGIGTLYRHFPTRDALNEAVYRREVEALCDGVDRRLEMHEPVDALSSWMREFAVYVAKKRGMAMALKSALGPDSELFTESHRRIQAAITTLVTRAADSGAIRDDVDPGDLLRAMGGICMATDSPGWSERTGRLVDLLIDGLRYGAPGDRRA
ncbi:MAG: TetR/AcrR family transcriptional regulator [Actinomycetota bacterium]|nr:TetR/AcrR family transcriptional regulator [Actinomycetota bacterium]